MFLTSGVYAAAYYANVEWVIVKGVASYFHQSQPATCEWMSFASTMAASLVAKMLNDPTVFLEWPHYNQGKSQVSLKRAGFKRSLTVQASPEIFLFPKLPEICWILSYFLLDLEPQI